MTRVRENFFLYGGGEGGLAKIDWVFPNRLEDSLAMMLGWRDDDHDCDYL